MELVSNFFSVIGGVLDSVLGWAWSAEVFPWMLLLSLVLNVIGYVLIKLTHPGQSVPDVIYAHFERCWRIGGLAGFTILLGDPPVRAVEYLLHQFTLALLKFVPPVGRVWVWATKPFVLRWRADGEEFRQELEEKARLRALKRHEKR